MKIAQRCREAALDEIGHDEIHRYRAFEQHLNGEPSGTDAGCAALGTTDRTIRRVALVRVRRLNRHVAEIELRNGHRLEPVGRQLCVAARIHALRVHLHRHHVVIKCITTPVSAIERRQLHRSCPFGTVKQKRVLHNEFTQ